MIMIMIMFMIIIMIIIIIIIIIMQASRISVSFGGHTAHCGTESEHQVLDGSNIFISLRKYWYYLVLHSNIYVKGAKMKKENNLVWLTFNSWCSLSVPQCTSAYRED